MDETSPAIYRTADGQERIFVTAVIDRPLLLRLEKWRHNRQHSRSQAIRQLLDDYLPTNKTLSE